MDGAVSLDFVPGFVAPVRRSLSEPILLGGAPRSIAILNGTLAAGSLLEISRLPGQAWCYDCNKAVALSTRLAPCSLCGGEKLDVIGGNELRVVDMEVE
mgnify:CR=1 FL=1